MVEACGARWRWPTAMPPTPRPRMPATTCWWWYAAAPPPASGSCRPGRRPSRERAALTCTGARLRRLTRRMTVFYEQYLRSVGLRLGQYSILAHLSSEPQSLLELAARLEMDRTTLSRGLRPLILNGWVVESRGTDARQHLFALSGAGRDLRGSPTHAGAKRNWRSKRASTGTSWRHCMIPSIARCSA